MAKHDSSNLAWFLAGVTAGALGAVLYAPRTGRETREALGETARKGRDLYEQSRRLASEAAESGLAAVERGKEAVKKLKTKQEKDEIEEPLGI